MERDCSTAMWLLSERADYASHRSSEREAQADGRRDRQRDARQHLPVRHLSANSRSHQAGGGSDGMSTQNIQIVSRRGFLGHVFSAGALVLGAQLLPFDAEAATNAAASAWHPGIWMGLEPD